MENTPQEELSKKERVALERTEKEKAQSQLHTKRKVKKYSIWVGVLVVIGALAFWGVDAGKKAEQARPGDHHASEGQDHVDIETHEHEYQTNPPTSGPHGAAIRFGIYSEEVEDGNAIHNIEHGGIWISYNDLTNEELSQLETIARKAPNAVLLAPRSANDHRISVASWQRLMHLEEVDVEKIEEYIRANINRSPEPLVR